MVNSLGLLHQSRIVTLAEIPNEDRVTYFGTPSAASFDHPFLPWDSAPFASCLGDAWRELLSAKARLVGLGDFLYKQKHRIIEDFDINSTS